MKVAIYTRVSTKDQNIEAQEIACKEYCQRNGHEVYAVYSDNGVSGAKDSRPAFNELLEDMRHYKFNMVVFTKLDRMGRSLKHLLNIFDEFKNKGVHFAAITQQIDTSSSMGTFQLQVLGAVAEFERNMISERTKEGLQYSKNRHKVGKRGPDKQPRKSRGSLRKKLS